MERASRAWEPYSAALVEVLTCARPWSRVTRLAVADPLLWHACGTARRTCPRHERRLAPVQMERSATNTRSTAVAYGTSGRRQRLGHRDVPCRWRGEDSTLRGEVAPQE